MPTADEIELVYLVAIAHVWARGSLFARVRTMPRARRVLGEMQPNGCARVIANPYARFWVELADCPLCSGFWIGALGHFAFLAWPGVVARLGLASLVGTLSLAVYGAVRRI